ncbi:phage holin family protein [Motiliproteus sp.]|uniref:phage holin family protein n=1 Tax=Motiliproteus sp. TaxID=1898955 RepID=UPI003BAA214F
MTFIVAELLIIALSCTISLRLLFYRRSGARFKRGYAALAWVLIVLSGGLALCMLTGRLSLADINPVAIVLLALVCVGVLLTRGNVAQLIRPHRWSP